MLSNVDYELLKYVAQFDKPTKIKRENLPPALQLNFKTMGLDKDTVHGRLFELSKTDLVKSKYAGMWEIQPAGKLAIEQYEAAQPKPSFASQMDKVALFIIQPENKGKMLSEVYVSQTLGIDLNIVEAIHSRLRDRGFIDFAKAGNKEGFVFIVKDSLMAFLLETSFEEERLESRNTSTIINNHSTNVIGDGNAVGNNYSSFDKSFNPAINKQEPIQKSKIAWKTWAEIIAGILVISLAVLKFFKII